MVPCFLSRGEIGNLLKSARHTDGEQARQKMADKPSRLPAGEPRLRRVNLGHKSVRNRVEQSEGSSSKSQTEA